jgi:pyruvate dehydrogenase E1 component alpha subunit
MFPKLSFGVDHLLSCLETMLVIRRFEERAGQIYTAGKIRGFCHLYIGQEAVAVAASEMMKPCDSAITAYRAHGHMIARKASPYAVMAELMGKKSGSSKGKGGSMHTFFVENNFYGGHGIVGAQTSLGTGLAFAHAYKKDGGVNLTFLGDGAANQGQFFESMNMASLWNLPILYIIENNGYSMGTSVERGCAGNGLFHRGEPFGIQGLQCEGTDVREMMSIFQGAIEQVRNTQRPLLLEVMTYRFRGHSMSDPGKYREKSEVETAKTTRDPISLLSQDLMDQGLLSLEDWRKTEKKVKDLIADVLRVCEEDAFPESQELFSDILASCA